MAVIGSWGGVIFSVSSAMVKTFDNLKINSSVKYAEHERHLKKTLLEFTGKDAETLNFDMVFSAFLGVSPYNEMAKLDTAMNSGLAAPLIVGGRRIGPDKLVILSTSKEYQKFGKGGVLIQAKVSVSMKEYAGR